jgi:hypothetical protein
MVEIREMMEIRSAFSARRRIALVFPVGSTLVEAAPRSFQPQQEIT